MTKIKNMTDLSSISGYLKRINAEPRSLRTAVVKEMHGSYWSDVAIIKINQDGTVTAPLAYAPTEGEKSMIIAECAKADWPKMKILSRLRDLPPELKAADKRDIFEFKNVEGEIVMLQHRMERKGEKSYIPYTFWDDGEWRAMEPEGLLPLWGADQLKDQTTVFIHEGAKAARAMREMIEAKTPAAKAALAAHPWGDEMMAAAHVGWIGGALSPARTDWGVLQKTGVKRVYIVSDNDAPGVSAVPKIAMHLFVPTFQVQFTNEWPASFDLADPFPPRMFREVEGRKYYVGPSFRSCLHPATWATDQVMDANDKLKTVLRKNFKDMWSYVEEADLFVCVEMPEILRTEQVMNKMLASFSHTNQTSQLLVRQYTGRSAKLCYRPDIKGRLVTDNTTSAINLHTPTHIKSVAGNIKPFMDFMTYLLPNPEEKAEALRWCATLIAKPEIHMEYGMLLVSENQGIGKEQPLSSKILTPNGWKTMGDMKVGTEICDAFGGKQRVTGVFPQGVKHVYSVKFADGTIVKCGLNHNWLVSMTSKDVKKKKIKNVVRTTKELIQLMDSQNITIKSIEPVFIEPEKDFFGKDFSTSDLTVRKEFLIGVMDNNGTIKNGNADFSTVSQKLAKMIFDVVLSLGGAANIIEEGNEYIVKIRTPFCPFSDPKKASKWRPNLKACKEYGNRIVSIDKTGIAQQQCISVDGKEHLYITDGFKATHNTTLGGSILCPLVGIQNVSAPTTGQIVQSEFNGWIANKRLCIINEIYEGHSWKAYNKLKSVITDKEIEVNEKYQRTYIIENWCHVFACSNSLKALRVEDSDRRWFYPEVTEDKWPRKNFENFQNWLKSGGLSIIKHWAENFSDYVSKGQPAPMTERKKELIIASRTEGQTEAAELAEAMNRQESPIVLSMKDVVDWVRRSVNGKVYDSDHEIRKVMKDVGVIWFDERILVNGRQQLVAMNRTAFEKISNNHLTKCIKNVASLIKSVDDDPIDVRDRKRKLFDDLRDMLKNPDNVMDSNL